MANSAAIRIAQGPTGPQVSGGPAVGTTVSTTNDSYTASQIRNYDLTMARTFLIWRVTETTGKKFWLRLYATSAARSKDSNRKLGTPIALGTQHGILFDLYIDQRIAVTPFTCSPPAVGSNDDASQVATIYASVKSQETGTQNIQVTISYIPMES